MRQYEIVVLESVNFPSLLITCDKVTMRIPAKITDKSSVIDFFREVAEEIGPVERQLRGSLNAYSSKLLMHTRNRQMSYCFNSNLFIPELQKSA